MFLQNVCCAFCAWLAVGVECVRAWLPASLSTSVSVCACVSVGAHVSLGKLSMLYYTSAIRHRRVSGKHIKLLPSTVSIRSQWTESITRALGDSRSPKMLNFGPTRLSARPFRVTTSNHFEQLKFNLTSSVTREVLIPPRMGCSLKSCSVFLSAYISAAVRSRGLYVQSYGRLCCILEPANGQLGADGTISAGVAPQGKCTEVQPANQLPPSD